MPEIIEHGVSGFIVDDIDGAVQAVANVQTLNRAEVRRCFEQRFTAERMAGDYVAIYQSLSVRATTDHRRAKGNELDVPRVRLTSRDILDNPWQWIHGSPGS